MEAAQLLAQQNRQTHGQSQHQRPLAKERDQSHSQKASEGVADYDIAGLRQWTAWIAKEQNRRGPKGSDDQHMAAPG